MNTLQENVVKFNNDLIASHDGGRLSSDSGLVLVDELMGAFQFTNHSENMITFNETRKYWVHTNHKILKQLIFQHLSPDEPLASQPSISRFLDRVTDQTIEDFQTLNQTLIDQARTVRNDTEMIIDIDSPHSDTFGHQEQTDYNAHYQTNGYHPLVAFDGLTGDFLKAKLRTGNQYTSNGVKDFLEPLLEHYN